MSLYCGYLSPIILEINFGESGSNVTSLYCSNITGFLSLSLNALRITENLEYCSTPSMSFGSFKFAIDILYSLDNSFP